MRVAATNRVFLALICAGLLSNVAACTIQSIARIGTESEFVHPNANVKTLGPVKVKISGGSGFFVPPPMRTAELDRRLYQAALSQVAGANVVIDYVVVTTIKTIPVLPVYFSELELEGTAAKVDVGQQYLH